MILVAWKMSFRIEFETIASCGILERRRNKPMDVDKLTTRDQTNFNIEGLECHMMDLLG
jgi:hypothetical protein